MTDTRGRAYELAEHYLLKVHKRPFSPDSHVEVRQLVDAIIDAAKSEIAEERGTLDREAVARANGMTYP